MRNLHQQKPLQLFGKEAMTTLGIIYHSANGHTEHIAMHVARGAKDVPGCDVHLLKALAMSEAPQRLTEYDGLIFGSPTYLGGVSGIFKSFMDSTGRLWRDQRLKGKLASGFTVSSLPAGDKQTTLLSMFVFAMQHGMMWVGNPVIPEQQAGIPYEEAVNRLGSWSGLMAQAGPSAPVDSFAPGDLKSAYVFGRNFSQMLVRLGKASIAEAAQ
jgi:NAD(P)H dehydrogenase (quinone)